MTLAPFRLAPSRFLINLRLISNPSMPSERAKGRWERREYIKRHSELQITNCNLIPRAPYSYGWGVSAGPRAQFIISPPTIWWRPCDLRSRREGRVFAHARVDTFTIPFEYRHLAHLSSFLKQRFTFYINQDIDISLLIYINLHRLVAQTSSAQIIVSGRKTIIILRIRNRKKKTNNVHMREWHTSFVSSMRKVQWIRRWFLAWNHRVPGDPE